MHASVSSSSLSQIQRPRSWHHAPPPFLPPLFQTANGAAKPRWKEGEKTRFLLAPSERPRPKTQPMSQKAKAKGGGGALVICLKYLAGRRNLSSAFSSFLFCDRSKVSSVGDRRSERADRRRRFVCAKNWFSRFYGISCRVRGIAVVIHSRKTNQCKWRKNHYFSQKQKIQKYSEAARFPVFLVFIYCPQVFAAKQVAALAYFYHGKVHCHTYAQTIKQTSHKKWKKYLFTAKEE